MVGQAPWPRRHGQGRHGQGRSTSHRDGVAGTVWCLQEVCRLVTWTHEAYAKMRLWPRVCGTGRRDDRARVPCPSRGRTAWGQSCAWLRLPMYSLSKLSKPRHTLE